MNGKPNISRSHAWRNIPVLGAVLLFTALLAWALYSAGLPLAVALAAALVLGICLYSFFFHSDVYLRFTTWLFSRIFYRIRVHGLRNIPAKGGVILVCNHVSFIDWALVVACVGRPPRFVIDHVFYRGWFLRGILDLVRAIPIADPREDRSKISHAYDRIVAELEAGEVVCIFPEGKITHDGKLNHFKPGVMKVLKRAPVPVVPMALTGLWGSIFSRRGGPALKKLPRRFRARVELVIGEPLPPGEVTLAGLEAKVRALKGKRAP